MHMRKLTLPFGYFNTKSDGQPADSREVIRLTGHSGLLRIDEDSARATHAAQQAHRAIAISYPVNICFPIKLINNSKYPVINDV